MRSWNSSWSTTPSWFRSASANAARGSYFLASSARDDEAASATAMIGIHVTRMNVSSALDLPRPVGLAAGGSVGLVLLAAHDDRLLVLPAVLAVRKLIRPRRGDRAGVPGVRVLPRGRLPSAIVLECLLRGLRRHSLVARVEAVPDEAADERAAETCPDNRARTTAGERSDPSTGRPADHGSEHGLRILLDGRAGRRGDRERDDQSDRGGSG